MWTEPGSFKASEERVGGEKIKGEDAEVGEEKKRLRMSQGAGIIEGSWSWGSQEETGSESKGRGRSLGQLYL